MKANPKCRLRGSIPMALQTLYLPPTQSQKPNTLSSAMPNLFVSGRLVDTALKWAVSLDYMWCYVVYLIITLNSQVVLEDPLTTPMSVHESFSSREGLRVDDAECLLDVETLSGSQEVHGVHVGQEPQLPTS